ncbi:phosphopantetheine-binding protein [Kitasatospora sp. NPDC004669]|uniref:acyl carrier protein n=1 Tax=Kitasatospora sp. NPDC004669 TaxID=3154555 RepID=UPI0033A5389E
MTETAYIDPEVTEAQELVLRWAAEILEEPVTAEDNFLDLGGHSVLALELGNRIKEHFGVELDIEVLFERSVGEVAAGVVRLADTTVQSG